MCNILLWLENVKMKEIDEIGLLVADDRYDEAISRLDHAIEHDAGNAALWYERGRIYWRLGQKTNAISDYEEAVYLDPHSPARHALELARQVMDFYNPDLLNP